MSNLLQHFYYRKGPRECELAKCYRVAEMA